MRLSFIAATLVVTSIGSSATAGLVVSFSDVSGLAGEAEFTLVNATTLQVRLRNISTGVPGGFSNSDQLLTSLAFNLPGAVGITSGSVFTGATSSSVNFDITNVGANADVSGEWGYGNGGTTGFGSLVNYFSSNNAGATAFGAVNLDATAGLDGPQGGLISSTPLVPIGGLGAIQDEVVATLNLSAAISDLSFLSDGVMIEFGSDAAFIPNVPAPGALAMLAVAGLVGARRRRHN